MAKAASTTQPYYTMIFDQSAHLDWDWIRTFAQNYWYYTNGSGVNDIIAAGILNAQQGKPAYYYTVCEMGFFRRFIEEHPDQIAAIQALGDNFQVIGGGVTSPDCQVCSGEGFVRNYLVGQTWLKRVVGLTPKPHSWLPDDFGQGPELPALLVALGFASVAFSRLPGTNSNCYRPGLANDLVANGLDFIWQAADGSALYAHWLNPSYNVGNQLSNGPEAINTFLGYYGPKHSTPPSYTGAVTPFMYIPIDDDFSMPVAGLAQDITDWNTNAVPAGANASNVGVVQGTFDQLIAGIKESPETPLTRAPYNGTPYWTGYYASRPELKILHYEAVRALLAAEVIAMLTQPWNTSLNSMLPTGFWDDLDKAWTDFAPSTHHDYVCGTAPDPVYASDQLPLLRGAAAAARSLRGIALDALAGMTAGTGNVLVANPLGFTRTGVAEIPDIAPNGTEVSWPYGSSTPAQVSADGGMLVMATVPSFGYVAGYAGNGNARLAKPASLTGTATGGFILANEYLSATIEPGANWGLTSLIDKAGGGAEVLKAGGTGNDIAFYDDRMYGGLYQFSNEYADQGGAMPVIGGVTFAVSGAGLGAVIVEHGPLRVRVRTDVMISVPVGGQTEKRLFTREYILVAGEPFLRMKTTGAAPSTTAVMTVFPLAAEVTAIDHGTPYHWTSVQPLSGFWGPPLFRATHDFLIPRAKAGGPALAAAYHAGMPPWAFDAKGALIGCLLRNTPYNAWGAWGTDPAPHTQSYALRVPTGLGGPETGQPLKEALGFHTPLEAVQMPDGYQYPGMIGPAQGKLASLDDADPAVLTVAKPGSYDPTSLILRLYQASNAPQTFTVSLPGGQAASAGLVTAAETAWSGGGGAAPAQGGVSVQMTGAVATVEIAGLGRPG